MASTEERLWRKSGETVGLLASFHGADYPSSCTEQTDLGCQEDLGELPDPLEEVDVVNPHYQPASMWTDSDASAIAFRALDLMFPHEDSPDDSSDWSDWSAREDVGDIDDAQVIDRNNEKDGPGSEIVDEFSTEEGSEEDDDYNGYSKEKDKETDCPGREVVDDCSTQEGSDKDNDCNGQAEEKDKETNCPGKNYPESEAEEIQYKWLVRYSKQVGYYANLRNEFMARGDEDSPFPPYPLFVFPDATAQCIRGGATATIMFTRPMTLLPLNQPLAIVHQNRCSSSFLCVCQALTPPIPLVCMEYLLFGMNWTSVGIIYLTGPEMMLSS